MPTASRTDLLEKFRATPQHLKVALANLAPAQLERSYRDGGWTARQVVHHIADSHAHAYLRFKRILTEEHPTLQPYDQDIWATLPDVKGDVASSVAMIDGIHRRWYDLMSTMTEAQWARTAYHPDYGDVSAQNMLETYANHGMNHVAQIALIKG